MYFVNWIKLFFSFLLRIIIREFISNINFSIVTVIFFFFSFFFLLVQQFVGTRKTFVSWARPLCFSSYNTSLSLPRSHSLRKQNCLFTNLISHIEREFFFNFFVMLENVLYSMWFFFLVHVIYNYNIHKKRIKTYCCKFISVNLIGWRGFNGANPLSDMLRQQRLNICEVTWILFVSDILGEDKNWLETYFFCI